MTQRRDVSGQNESLPGGGERLETQGRRISSGRGRWIPVAIALVVAAAGVLVVATRSAGPGRDPDRDELAVAGDVGESLDLPVPKGKMRVTVSGAIDPLSATAGDEPPPGTRFVGIELVARNRGEATYEGRPTPRLITADRGWLYPVRPKSGARCARGLTSLEKVSPGATREACVRFAVPTGERLRAFRLALIPRTEPETRIRSSRRGRVRPKVKQEVRFGQWSLR